MSFLGTFRTQATYAGPAPGEKDQPPDRNPDGSFTFNVFVLEPEAYRVEVVPTELPIRPLTAEDHVVEAELLTCELHIAPDGTVTFAYKGAPEGFIATNGCTQYRGDSKRGWAIAMKSEQDVSDFQKFGLPEPVGGSLVWTLRGFEEEDIIAHELDVGIAGEAPSGVLLITVDAAGSMVIVPGRRS